MRDGSEISKRLLFDLIQFSKVPGSIYWSGESLVINNTPQQGINWVGKIPALYGVLVKVRSGNYKHDGWVDSDREMYRYSLKARKGVVSLMEKANRALLNQPDFGYPILLYRENKNKWIFEGVFGVSECNDEYVVLGRRLASEFIDKPAQSFLEGGRKFVSHLVSERNAQVVKLLKANASYMCEICKDDFHERYGIQYIEAHHKIPVSSLVSETKVTMHDLALLCSNCHSAVHAYMREGLQDFDEIKVVIRAALVSKP
jgi:putative restriction endonuclease